MEAPDDTREQWKPARLLPTVGLRGQEEQEQRATSSLLAVAFAVPEFAYSLFAPLGAPRGRIETFTEIQLRDGAGARVIPDGAVIIERGAKSWKCLIEVKTGAARLGAEQVSKYLDWAKEHDFDAVLTISNEITPTTSDSPVTIDRRKLRKVDLHHLSWWRILTEAIVQHRHRGVSDPDQAWLLGELIAYLDHERSGASGFQGMGESWVTVRTSAGNETLRQADPEVRNVVERWEQFVDYMALGLGQDLGRDVTPVRPRKLDQTARIDQAVKGLVETGCLTTALKVPDAVGSLAVEADLRTRRITTSVQFRAPSEGRPQTRINWLLRQLSHAPPDLRIDVAFASTRETTSMLLADARDDPAKLLSNTDSKREPRTFTIALTRKMGLKRDKGEGAFATETRRQAIDFYRDLIQELKEWQPSAPRLPRPASPSDGDGVEPEHPPFSAVDAEPGRPATTP